MNSFAFLFFAFYQMNLFIQFRLEQKLKADLKHTVIICNTVQKLLCVGQTS